VVVRASPEKIKRKKRTENKGNNASLPRSKCCQRTVGTVQEGAIEAFLVMLVQAPCMVLIEYLNNKTAECRNKLYQNNEAVYFPVG
jgi:hypothetical protein